MATKASASAHPAADTQPAGGAGGGAGGSSSGGAVTPGAYEFKHSVGAGEEFNLGLKASHAHPVPVDQAKLSKDIYETKNILKLLHGEGRLATKTYAEFINRVKEAASAGCIGPNVETALAAEALTQIRADVLRRVGRLLAFRYLCFLALWGLAGTLVGLAMAAAGYWIATAPIQLIGAYGLVLVGAMVGAWFGVAARRWQIALDELPGFLDVSFEPLIRMVFVAVVALVLAVFLHLNVLHIELGGVDLAGFVGDQSGKHVGIALLLGFIAGMSERAVSKQLVDQVGKALPQS